MSIVTTLEALCRQLRDLAPLEEPETTKQIGREAAGVLASISRLRDALVAAREYVETVRKNHWPHSIPAANLIYAIDAALGSDHPLVKGEPDRPEPGADGSTRKSHYGNGLQPWDTIVANGWGPIFAASNVIKYLRRDKDVEGSLEKARWYYERLYEFGAKNRDNAPFVVARLELSLTREERIRIRSSNG